MRLKSSVKGGKDGIGVVKNIDRFITEADGKVLLNLPKNRYFANFPTEDEVTEERFRPENARNTEVYSVDEVKQETGSRRYDSTMA